MGVISRGDFVFIAKRPTTVHQGGLWEFPGGKIEGREDVQQALTRELQEELGIEVLSSSHLITITHHYPDKSVCLEVRHVDSFRGDPRGAEGQEVRWVHKDALRTFSFPKANRAIVNALLLPNRLAITGNFHDASEFGKRLSHLITQGIRLVQFRAPNKTFDELAALYRQQRDVLKRHSVHALINGGVEDFKSLMLDEAYDDLGLHLSAQRARNCVSRPIPLSRLLGVSCHNMEEIKHALSLEPDYLVISPVCKTASHPDAQPIGWDGFTSLAGRANVPCYALGGMTTALLPEALQHGGQGIAGIREWWK